MPNDAQPVAWMYSHPDDPLPPSVRTERHDKYDFAAMAKRGWTETPLYAHPPAPAQPADVERVARAIHAHLCRRDIMQYLDNEEDCEGLARAALAAMPATQRQRIEALEADNARLREALKPFADTGEFLDLETTGFADEDVLNLIVEDGHLVERIAVGAFRSARQALGEGKP